MAMPHRLGLTKCSVWIAIFYVYTVSISYALILQSDRRKEVSIFPPGITLSHVLPRRGGVRYFLAKSLLVKPYTTEEERQEVSTYWYPRELSRPEGTSDHEISREEVQQRAVQLAASFVKKRLDDSQTVEAATNNRCKQASKLVVGRFMDLTCTEEGEKSLEALFVDDLAGDQPDDVIRATVMVFQSLCVMGTQVGVKGAPEQLRKLVAHLDPRNEPSLLERDLLQWDRDSIRRLKYKIDRAPGTELLAELSRKRTPQGAFDLLVELGAWKKHEDLALLRSGFPIRFSGEELQAARMTASKRNTIDPDELLGIRQDLRHMKVYTIDSASTSEIDDGLSIETIRREDGTESHRIYIHIADVDRWAPRRSVLFETARRRVTSLYLPTGSISMLPPIVSSDIMSLRANRDAHALSLSVEVNEDGSVIPSSVTVTSSIIRVSYRLTYDEVDEMLEEGIGYQEEWQLGALLLAAKKRRAFRVKNGSAEGLVPSPVPQASVSTFPDKNAPDGVGVSISVQVSHNAGTNQTARAQVAPLETYSEAMEAPVSAAYLLVTECMILAGEALGYLKINSGEPDGKVHGSGHQIPNRLRLPFRSQRKPDFTSRAREMRVMMDLQQYKIGNGLCHAWYSRRFLQSVQVNERQMPHSGLGLECYVQWTSPIRRFGDLQVHAMVKRFLRRRRVNELIRQGLPIPSKVTFADLGLLTGTPLEDNSFDAEIALNYLESDIDKDIDFLEGLGLVGAARTLQRQSQQYWMFEYIRRLREKEPGSKFSAVVLGCIDPERRQYAIYLFELGLEHRYSLPAGTLDMGATLQLKVDSVSPRNGILTFVQAV